MITHGVPLIGFGASTPPVLFRIRTFGVYVPVTGPIARTVLSPATGSNRKARAYFGVKALNGQAGDD